MKLLIIIALVFSSCMTEKKVLSIISKQSITVINGDGSILGGKGLALEYTKTFGNLLGKIDAVAMPNQNAFEVPGMSTKPILSITNCQHRSVSVTAAFCPDKPCNTATCLQCGHKWSSY